MSKRSLLQRGSDNYLIEAGERNTLEEDRDEVEGEGEGVVADGEVVEIEEDEEDEDEDEDDDEDEEEELLQVARVLNGDRRKKIVVTVIFGGRTHSRNRETPVHCQVDGCGADLREAKVYHRKHRVCEAHSKATSVLFGGVEMRYCQQCSRFHEVSQFDGPRKSCRLRLAGHNERRRKMYPDCINGIEEPPCSVKPNLLEFARETELSSNTR